LIGRLSLSFLLGSATLLCGQALPTASRAGDAQIGIAYALGHPDYPPTSFQGIGAYADFSFRPSFGIEAEFHQINHTGGYPSYQRTYEAGARYLRAYGPFVPYAKIMAGRGDFEYPFAETTLGYNLYAAGAGLDFNLAGPLRLRAEYEFQHWFGFQNTSLDPQIVTIGLAYHFASDRHR
jgi:opacity protein-like surface antigen